MTSRLQQYNKEWYKKNKESEKLKKKEYRKKNKKKIAKKAAETYQKNKEENVRVSREYRKNNVEKCKGYREENKEKRAKYTRAHYRLSKNTQERHLQKRLDERRIDPTVEQLDWMRKTIQIYCRKYRYLQEEVKGEAYLGLIAAIRTIKNEEWFDIKTHIKSKVWWYLLNSFSRDIKNKKYEISLYTKIIDDYQIIDIIVDDSFSPNFDIVDDAHYFTNIIREGFISSVRHRKVKYSGKTLYNIWYDKNVKSMTPSELQKKYNMTYRQMDSILTVVKQKFKKIQEQIKRDNPSWN